MLVVWKHPSLHIDSYVFRQQRTINMSVEIFKKLVDILTKCRLIVCFGFKTEVQSQIVI